MLPFSGLEGLTSRRADFPEVSVGAIITQKWWNVFGFQFEQGGCLNDTNESQYLCQTPLGVLASLLSFTPWKAFSHLLKMLVVSVVLRYFKTLENTFSAFKKV